jgi:hypothetical protein
MKWSKILVSCGTIRTIHGWLRHAQTTQNDLCKAVHKTVTKQRSFIWDAETYEKLSTESFRIL